MNYSRSVLGRRRWCRRRPSLRPHALLRSNLCPPSLAAASTIRMSLAPRLFWFSAMRQVPALFRSCSLWICAFMSDPLKDPTLSPLSRHVLRSPCKVSLVAHRPPFPAGIPRRHARAAAAIALVPDGCAFVLTNRGPAGSTSACCRRSRTPLQPQVWANLARNETNDPANELWAKLGYHTPAIDSVLDNVDIATGARMPLLNREIRE